VLGILELTHPTWNDGSVSQAVADSGGWWTPLHLMLIVGYLGLALTLWPDTAVVRTLFVAFLVCNTVFLALDGVVVGSLAASNPAAADALWSSPFVTGLADVSGALWCAALLALAATRTTETASTLQMRSTIALLAVVWMAFVASLLAPAAIVFGSIALVIAVYRTFIGLGPGDGVYLGLLALAALSRQHVGPEAALGMLWLALAAMSDRRRRSATGRSAPAASCPPGSG
jgi:hypothetical protein